MTDIQAEYDQMTKLGVVFTGEPTKLGPGPTVAVLADTCSNLIQIAEV